MQEAKAEVMEFVDYLKDPSFGSPHSQGELRVCCLLN